MAVLASKFHRSPWPATTLGQWLASYLLQIGDGIVSAVMGYFLDVTEQLRGPKAAGPPDASRSQTVFGNGRQRPYR